MKLRPSLFAAPALVAPLFLAHCSSETPPASNPSTGGAPLGGASTGGAAGAKGGTAGASTGGTTGGVISAGGGGSGGLATGGVATGGIAVGGTTGGVPIGGGGGGSPGGAGAGGKSTSGAGGMLSAGGGGASGGGSGGAIEASFATVKAVINKSCFGGLCHNLPENPLQLTVDGKLYTTLTTYKTENCGPLIKSGVPAESAFTRLLKGPCNGTDRMPYNMCFEDTDESCVPPNYIAAIEQWIANGAPQ